MTGKRHIPTRRNPMATVLATGFYRPKRVMTRKGRGAYTRKGRRQSALLSERKR